MLNKSKKSSFNELDFRKWCVEMALRWPININDYRATIGGGRIDANLLGKVQEIYNWVKNK